MAVRFVKEMPPGGALRDALLKAGIEPGKVEPGKVEPRQAPVVTHVRLRRPFTGEVVALRTRVEGGGR